MCVCARLRGVQERARFRVCMCMGQRVYTVGVCEMSVLMLTGLAWHVRRVAWCARKGFA